MALSKDKSLTEKQKSFCSLWVSKHLGYGLMAYAEAYQIDISTSRGNQVARSAASRMLKNPKVSEYVEKLRDLMGC